MIFEFINGGLVEPSSHADEVLLLKLVDVALGLPDSEPDLFSQRLHSGESEATGAGVPVESSVDELGSGRDSSITRDSFWDLER